MAQRADMTGRVLPDELRVSSFARRFPHYAWTAAVSPFRFRWDNGVCVFRSNLPPACSGVTCNLSHPSSCMLVNHGPSADLQRRIQAMEMRCYRKVPRISYKDHVTNEEVRVKIQQAIGPHEDLLTIVKRRRLHWFGHVSRSLGLAETILQDTVKG